MLRIILVIAMIAVSLLLMGCGDDVIAPQGAAVSEDATSAGAIEPDVEEALASDVAVSGDVAEEQDGTASGDAVDPVAEPDVEEPGSLPADPTEDPQGHSAYYSFPDWEVPPSSDDNR